MRLIGKRGQGIAIDFLFAILIFLLLLNASISLLNSSSAGLSNKGLINRLNDKAAQTIDTLVRTAGQPNDWETKTIGDAEIIGLAKADRVLDEAKVAKLVEWAADYSDTTGDYNETKSLLLIGYEYYFVVKDETGTVVQVTGGSSGNAETGQPSQSKRDKMTAVNVKRIVNFKGEEAIAELTLYYPTR